MKPTAVPTRRSPYSMSPCFIGYNVACFFDYGIFDYNVY